MKIAIVAVLHLDRLIIHTSGLGPIKQYFQRNFVLSTLIFFNQLEHSKPALR